MGETPQGGPMRKLYKYMTPAALSLMAILSLFIYYRD